jgi:uncharacterized membrane protein
MLPLAASLVEIIGILWRNEYSVNWLNVFIINIYAANSVLVEVAICHLII